MKKELKVVAIVLVALIVFLSGFGIGSTKGGFKINVNVENKGGQSAGVVATAQPTATPTTPAPTTPAPTTPAPSDTPATSDQAQPSNNGTSDTTPAPSENNGGASATGMPSSKEEIVAKYNELINGMKKNPGACKLHKVTDTKINVTDAPAMKDQINNIVQGLVKPSDQTYTFTGNGSMGTEDTNNNAECDMMNIINPGGKEVALKAEGVKEATATASGDGYTLNIVLAEEKSTFDGTTTVNPVHHESCLTPLNLATLDLGPAKIAKADMTYPGATLTLTVDGQGRLTQYKSKLPMSGGGTGKLVVSLSVGLDGEMNETYDFTY